MTKHAIRMASGAAALFALTATSFADVKLNDNFSVGGYVVGSYTNTKVDGSPDSDRLDLDAVKTTFTGTFKPVTGVVSLFYPYTDNGTTILDAYATYDCGGGYSVTGGKFLSYLGYEAFDPVNMTQITYGAPTAGTLFSIPAYHSGLRFDYSSDSNGAGIAILDSVYAPTIFKGDGELKHNAGFEAFYAYKGTPGLVLWAGLAYDTKGNGLTHSILTLDFWAQYAVTKQVTIAGEFCSRDGGDWAKGDSWLAFLSYAPTDKTSIIFRISGDNLKATTMGPDYIQYTVCPTWTLTPNLSVRAEYSYYDYSNNGGYSSGGSKSFWGVQGLFKF